MNRATHALHAVAILVILGIVGALPAFAGKIRVIDDNDTVVVRGNVHPLARPEFDAGATDPSLPMERMIFALRFPPDRQAAMDRFLADQQDPASPDFHRWLTPEEFGERFGPAPEDVAAATGWLASHGFVVEEVGRGRAWINFSGTAAKVERAFHTRMRDYRVDGMLRHANAQDPSIPRGLADLVAGVVSLHNFPRKSMSSGIRPAAPPQSQPDYTQGGTHFLVPGDFAIIYNVNALYGAGIDGTGQSIAIVGRTHPSSANWSTFRSTFGLPDNPPLVIVNGTDPGDLGASEDNEADLDVEWSGAVAKNATIKFVVSKSTNTTDGVDLSAQYIVNNNISPVMSTSFGLCEALMGSGNTFYNNLWAQAAAQGITSFVSSGDSGAAGCNSGSDATGSVLGVNGIASTPYNVAVGGTEFNEGAGSYWNGSNSSDYSSARSYIPEMAWNESGSAAICPSGDTCGNLWATGGGTSMLYDKPSWQVAPGVPADGKRDVPDVSLTAAAGHDGYLVVTTGSFYAIGGTSASAPSFAGIMALVVQKTGQRQGNANVRFYQLGNTQYGFDGGAVFHDITLGSNSVPGVTGYTSTAGYDRATGLGSVDANALVTYWLPPDLTISSTHVGNFTQGQNGAQYTITVTNSGTGVTSAPVTVTDILPSLVTATALAGTGWTCNLATLNCSRSDVLASGASYPAITLTVNVANAPASVTNSATVAGGGELNTANDSATDVTTVNQLQYNLDVIFAGSGGGTVYNTATQLTCGSSCSSPVDAGSNVALRPSVDQFSLFGGWSGVCANPSGDCSFIMNGATSATATFTFDAAHSVLIAPQYYSTLTAAFQNARDNDVIEAWGVAMKGDFVYGSGAIAALKGGYNASYTDNSGITTLQGSMTVSSGELTVENVAVW